MRLPGTGLSANAPVAVVGYSQGGHGAGCAAELAPSYAPELKIKARTDGGDNVGLVMAAGFGLDVTYPEPELAPYLNDDGRAAFADIKTTAPTSCPSTPVTRCPTTPRRTC